MTERLVPFYCPYCGEESLEPVGERGEWHCTDCTRYFILRSGVRQPASADPTPLGAASPEAAVRQAEVAP
jgi:ribosomal protein L37AE/L43A